MAQSITPTFTFRDGKTINRVGYGAMRLTGQPGNFGPYAAWEEGIALLRRARDLGVQHIDTARAYGPHHNERLIAEALGGADGFDDTLFIASKGGVEKDERGIRRDTRPHTMTHHLDESLRNLKAERIDLYYVHAPDRVTPVAESIAALEEARKAGKIARIGISNVSREQIEEAMAVAPISAVQNRYSPADATDQDLESLIDWLADEGIAFVPHGPLGANPMQRGATTDPRQALLTLLERAPNVLVIPGTTTVAHLEANAAVLPGENTTRSI
ncbi:MAG: aldo/keto reductase [Pseudomonadota bacterium]